MSQILSPSILSANFLNLEKDLSELKENNIGRIHVDIMDGGFVPNITFGPDQVRFLKDSTDFYLDCHLMINNLDVFVDRFIDLSVGCITIHQESHKHIHKFINQIKRNNIDCGVALNPATSIYNIIDILDMVDKVLIMTVDPGFGGQKFIGAMLRKIEMLKELMYKYNIKNTEIQVDGGINLSNIDGVYNLGVRDIVVGSYIFNYNGITNNINSLLNKLRQPRE